MSGSGHTAIWKRFRRGRKRFFLFLRIMKFKDVARVFVPSIPLAATSACPEPVEGRWGRRPRLQGHRVFLDRGAIRQLGNIRQYLSLPFVRR